MRENKMTFEDLYRPIAPWIAVYTGPQNLVKVLSERRQRNETNRSPLVRRLRGSRMRTKQALMREFAEVLQFFEGFGANWDALEECLDYLDDNLPASGYVLVVSEAEELLAEEDSGAMTTFLSLLRDVGCSWSEPVVGNQDFDRSPVPFHLVLQLPESATLEERLERFRVCGELGVLREPESPTSESNAS